MPEADLTVSIVSHGQAVLVAGLLQDFRRLGVNARIIVTYNISEFGLSEDDKSGLEVEEIVNTAPQGFGYNHNQAFQRCKTKYFVVLNPDLRLKVDPFTTLLQVANEHYFGSLAPLVRNCAGLIEDSARRFPTATGLLAKALGLSTERCDHSLTELSRIDWVAGMFMLFDSKTFKEIGGFDERYFLYYEDADICTRLWLRGLPVMVVPDVEVIHDAQRSSHRNLRYLKWHLASMARYLGRYAWRLPRH